MSLARRVADLEDYSGGVCSACGHDPGALVSYMIHWEGDPDAPEESSLPCHHCGNVSTLVVDWQDTPRSTTDSEPDDEHAQEVPDYPPSFAAWDEGGGQGGK